MLYCYNTARKKATCCLLLPKWFVQKEETAPDPSDLSLNLRGV